MNPTRLFSRFTPVFTHLRIAIGSTLVLAAIALAISATRTPAPLQSEKPAYTPKKHDADFFKPGRNAEAAVVAESKNPDSSPEVESYLLRAYPSDEVPSDATFAAQSDFAALNANAHSPGSWQLIGPSKATYPGVLDVFLFDGAQYVASGRVTAIAIGSTCKPNNCPVYVAAAGGGIWKANDVLAGSTPVWQFISGNFPAPAFPPGVSTSATNAIGSILIDPSDPTNNTLYVGTGEPNASGDSEAGVGIYKSTDGGQTWTVVPDSQKFFQRAIGQMDFDKDGKLLVPIASSVRGVSSVTSGASSSGATGHPLATRGLYRCDGVTCTLIRPIVAVVTARGSTTVKHDPTHPDVIYVNEFSRGVWRSVNNGVTFTQIKTPRNATLSTDRAEFDVTTLANGNTRMYVGVGNQSQSVANRAHFFRTDDASGAAVFADMTTPQVENYCTGQCWYDNMVYTPKDGDRNIVYVGGSFSYSQLFSFGSGKSNGRAWLLSTDGGMTWSDLTQDGNKNNANGMHPDQHAIVTIPGKPFQAIFGSDGGVIASDGKFADVSYKCDSRGLSPADNAFCKSLLNRVPNQLYTQNTFLSTLQFQSLSVSSQSPLSLLQGGTQDNGTFQYNGSRIVWPQIIYGDGGQSGFMVTNDAVRFNTFTGQANDANFQNGDPTKWVIISAPILSSPEGAYFYPPIIADPNSAMAGSIFQGSFSVWRTQDWGGSQATLEANCPEFTTSATQPGCGDFVPLGCTAPFCATGSGTDSGDLRGLFYGGADRVGGAVAWLQRYVGNTGTMWAATGAGRVFVSDNVDAAAPSVLWNRVDPNPAHLNTPSRAISAIAVDPANGHHAWISYNGYNVNTPLQPGHVFDVTWSGVPLSPAIWTNISFNLPDFPITALVRDDVTGDLYAGSDFGVMKLPFGTTTWVVAGSGLPAVEVPGLTINSSARVIYAATHGRSAWSMQLP